MRALYYTADPHDARGEGDRGVSGVHVSTHNVHEAGRKELHEATGEPLREVNFYLLSSHA